MSERCPWLVTHPLALPRGTLGPALSLVLRAAGFNSQGRNDHVSQARIGGLASGTMSHDQPIRGEGGCGAMNTAAGCSGMTEGLLDERPIYQGLADG